MDEVKGFLARNADWNEEGGRDGERKKKCVFYGSEDRRHDESTGLLPFVRVIEQNSWST